MFETDKTKQLSDMLYLASDSYRVDMSIDDLTLIIVVCKFGREWYNKHRVQIKLTDNNNFPLFFTGSWL